MASQHINLDTTEVQIREECDRCHGAGEQPWSNGQVCTRCDGSGKVTRWVPLLDFMAAINVQPADAAERMEAEIIRRMTEEPPLLSEAHDADCQCNDCYARDIHLEDAMEQAEETEWLAKHAQRMREV